MNNEQTAQKALNLLGIAQRANKLVSGELAVEQCVRSGKAKILFVAADASDATKKKYDDMAKYRQVEVIYLFSKQSLGECIGKNYRAAVALSDRGLTNAILRIIQADKDKLMGVDQCPNIESMN